MFGIATTVLASLGRERIAAVLSFVTLAAVASGCWIFASAAPFGSEQLHVNAIAVSVALAFGLIAAAIVVTRISGGFVPVLTAGRVLVAVAAIVAVGTRIHCFGRLLAPLASIAIVAIYAVILVVSRELGSEDLRAARSIVSRRRA